MKCQGKWSASHFTYVGRSYSATGYTASVFKCYYVNALSLFSLLQLMSSAHLFCYLLVSLFWLISLYFIMWSAVCEFYLPLQSFHILSFSTTYISCFIHPTFLILPSLHQSLLSFCLNVALPCFMSIVSIPVTVFHSQFPVTKSFLISGLFSSTFFFLSPSCPSGFSLLSFPPIQHSMHISFTSFLSVQL